MCVRTRIPIQFLTWYKRAYPHFWRSILNTSYEFTHGPMDPHISLRAPASPLSCEKTWADHLVSWREFTCNRRGIKIIWDAHPSEVCCFGIYEKRIKKMEGFCAPAKKCNVPSSSSRWKSLFNWFTFRWPAKVQYSSLRKRKSVGGPHS